MWEKGGQGGPWNYQWIQFFEEAEAAGVRKSASEILEFLEDLESVLDDIIADPSKAVIDYGWRSKPQ